jgi:hypothetical protein
MQAEFLRTALSGSAYRGSNPWGAANLTLSPVPAPDEPNPFVASLPSRMQTLRRKSDKPGNSVHHRHCAAMKNGESNDPKAAGVASYWI